MKKVLILCLMLMIAFSFACSKKQKEEPQQTTPAAEGMKQTGMPVSLFDPVSKEEVDAATAQFTYTYNNVVYCFTSAENMETFKANPEKYIAQTSAPTDSTKVQ